MASRLFIAAALGFTVALPFARAESTADKLSGLLNNSPFGISKSGGPGTSGPGDPLEFRSVMDEGGTKLFSIFDISLHRSAWVELNDSSNGFAVKSYDPAHESVTVVFHDKSLTLAIKRAAPVPQGMPVLAGGGVPMPNVPGQPGFNPQDQNRIQQIQEEVRRRRAMRQGLPGATGTPGAPGSSPGAMMGPQQPVLSNTPGAPTQAGGPQQPVPTNAPGSQGTPGNPAGPNPTKP